MGRNYCVLYLLTNIKRKWRSQLGSEKHITIKLYNEKKVNSKHTLQYGKTLIIFMKLLDYWLKQKNWKLCVRDSIIKNKLHLLLSISINNSHKTI